MKAARILKLPNLLSRKSLFLFGPRATGKTFLIREQLRERALVVDLLRSSNYLRLSANPEELEAIVGDRRGPGEWIVIDEVQKIPGLLDEVHRLIEERRLRFLLTGSSARKLRRGHVNLLAGRAWTANLFPLCFPELRSFDLGKMLRWGGLPMVVESDDKAEELDAYVRTYLEEEIKAEGLVRRLPPFARFLKVAAITNGQMLNFASIASDAGIPAATVREHYGLLEDTLVGALLPAWTKSEKRKAITTAKFYFFDTGVTHALSSTMTLDRNSDLYGRSFEQWIFMELRAYLSYRRRREPLSYWRSTHQHEVDFVVGDHTAIEVKATRRVTSRDAHGLRAISEEAKLKSYLLVSEDPTPATYGVVQCLPWRIFLEKLWGDDLFPA